MGRLPRGFARRTDGRLEYRFTLAGRRRSAYGHSIKECIEKADAMRLKAAQGVKVGADVITVGQYFDEWIETRSHAIRPATLKNRRGSFARIAPYVADIRLKDLDRRDILHAQAELAKRYCTSTVNMAVNAVKALCRAAVADRILVYDPGAGIQQLRRKEQKATQTIHRALTLEEQALFMRTALERSYYYPLYAFMLQTGVRCGEALALTWDDIDNIHGLIHVTKTITLGEDKRPTVGMLPKTSAGCRDIPLTDGIRDALAEQRRRIIATHGIAFAHLDCRIFLGLLKPERILDSTAILQNMDTVTTAAGMRHIGTHTLRDTFATRAIEQGMQPNTLKEILGHANIAMTMDLYAQVMDSEKQEAMQALRIVV